ncbi:MAG TPA: hypothetical protein VK663_14105 [Burkholderiales bacterium]|nr:hypothetical protein [Burkholderiales bacterium]
MSRNVFTSALPALIALSWCPNIIAQTPSPGAHPLVGKWQWTRPENKCTEIYDFRADGTVPVTSGAEKTDNRYTIEASPDPNGFYRLTMKTTKDYGGKDCADEETNNTGQESTNYVLFDPSKTMHIVCVEAKVERCFGPLRRSDK